MIHEVKIPHIAENVESGTIGSILVAQGDKVDEEQSLVEIETDKAATDIPSPAAGTVKEVKVSEGDEVKIGEVIILIEAAEGGEAAEEEKEEPKEEDKKEVQEPEAEEKAEAEPASGKEEPTQPEPSKPSTKEAEQQSSVPKAQEPGAGGKNVPAPPSVRRFARELGVDITLVEGTGPGKRITIDDVKAYTKRTMQAGGSVGGGTVANIPLPDFSQWGETERESMSKIRQITADNMTASWQNIPHVTQFDEANVSELEKFMQKAGKQIEKAGGKLTVTAILLKISALALQKFTRFNASLDLAAKEIVYKKYVHVGIAVDTPQGLLVPVIRDVDKKSLTDLSLELSDIAKKTRDRKISPDALQGGNFTISNLGGIGGTGFTPVVLPPQVAILGVSRTQTKPVWNGHEFEPASVLPLSLSYDHRIIDGADGARFLRWMCAALENPMSIFL
ncbi:MAG: branched-chain alpha-keto acid dehydrogenase subunit E2 [Bacteroidetes bacterium]|jgi:pyruvate dehydrogenase E2 component (dihydrolipoamide acetyltransferase)|nr:branched-chain alpha-keto acid dehydrogenase subunit E2 [Bacteroidota bacterium]